MGYLEESDLGKSGGPLLRGDPRSLVGHRVRDGTSGREA